MYFFKNIKLKRVVNFSILWIFFLIFLTFFANFIANDKPLYAKYNSQTYFPVIYDIFYQWGFYQWDSELINKDWKKLPLENTLWTMIPFSPEQLDMENSPASPPFSSLKVNNQTFYHYLGTDELGRDIASGLIYGTRYAMIISLLATLIATSLGILIGSIAGFWGDYDFQLSRYTIVILMTVGFWAFFINFYSRSYVLIDALSQNFYYFLWEFLISLLGFIFITGLVWRLFAFLKKKYSYLSQKLAIPLDLIILRLIEVKLSIPILLLIIILTSFAKPNLLLLIFIIAFSQWTVFARLIRAEILKIKNLDYISAVKVQGLSPLKILVYHVIPNAMPPIWVSISFAIASAILIESALSFLGLGVSHVSWGSLLKSGRNDLNAWWLMVFPGLMIFFTIFALNNFSEYLRRKLNPKKL